MSNGGGHAAELGLEELERLAAALARVFRTPCSIRPHGFDIAFSRDENRGQHHSTAILQKLERASDPSVRILGVTA